MPASEDPALELAAVHVALDDRSGSAKLACALAECFVARLAAAIEVTAARADYYLARVLSHQESLQAADTFLQVFSADVALHADLEDCGESARLDAARLRAAAESAGDLGKCQLQERWPDQRAAVATLYRRRGQPAAEEGGGRSLGRAAAVWLSTPYALHVAEWYETFILQKETVAEEWETEAQRDPRPASGGSDPEDGHESDSALECRRGARSPYLPPGASSGLAGKPPGDYSGLGAFLSSACPTEASTAPQPPSSPTGRRLAADLGAGSWHRGPQKSYFDLPEVCHERFPDHRSSGVVLGELHGLHERVYEALQQHVARLDKLVSDSERRARQPADVRLESLDAQRRLRAEVREAARDARAELARFRKQLRACADEAAAFGELLVRVARPDWWRRGGAAAAARRLQQRLASWWRGVARSLGQPGDSAADVVVKRLVPQE